MTNNFEREKREDYKAYLENRKLLEKAATDKRASTYLAMAEAASLEIGGRYKTVSPMSITGTTPIPQMPRQPEGSPWSNSEVLNGPDELGWSVEDIGEPAGSPAEVEEAARILRERQDPTVPSPTVDSADVALSAATVSLAVGVPIATSALQSNSSALLAPAASSTGGAEVGTAPPTHSHPPSSAANDSLAVRGGPAPEEVQRAGPRSFRRL
jgi:hypothetical protein